MTYRVPDVSGLPAQLRDQAETQLKQWQTVNFQKSPPRAIHRPNKYRAKAVRVDGHRFLSKLEANRYLWLKDMLVTGKKDSLGVLVSFGLWPRFTLPGGVLAELDSVQVWRDGERVAVVWEDVKGADNQSSRNKRKQVEALFGITVSLWPPR